MTMDALERSLNTLAGKKTDRIPVFCPSLEDRTFNEVLGKPPVSQELILSNPIAEYLLDNFGKQLTKPLFQPVLNRAMEKRISGAVQLGFDAAWALYEETFIVKDSRTMIRTTGSLYDLQKDGYGNMTYMYRGPAISSRADFEAWPHWPICDDVAQRAYRFLKKMNGKYGSDICLCGQGSAYGVQESLLWALGFKNMAIWIRKEEDLVKRFIAMAEELCMKTSMAVLDAGLPVVLQSDDLAFKTGPFMNPKLTNELFGPSYKRIIKAVHDRGGKYILHSCGDNTLLFDYFIEWGVDGLHAYENTSNVDIFAEKKAHGDRVSMIGGVGIDYLLTERSRDQEVRDQVRLLADRLGPGGRYFIAPIHSLSNTPARKLEVMIDAAREHGRYPISANG